MALNCAILNAASLPVPDTLALIGNWACKAFVGAAWGIESYW